MTTKRTHISSLSISDHSGTGNASGSFMVNFEGGYSSMSLDKEDIEKILAVAYECVMRSKAKHHEAIEAIQPPPMLGYDRTKTIESD